ncbi:MAG TPA: peptidase M3 [Candidatus Marinimicrobia bacterium]|nr:MAG: hypothetical protein AUJ47_05790 [Candidatus Marinimicrobia bacterium CG1_02_48_14]PIZ64652.1 MAG: peptidase M3 [Candidatus Marinimicrobia bacterium CG_4_10_14_0_2_um_filter_48_9]PJA52959.1 MAG: peptidase M3 [Candidatus Marinimicrobia bacterium CG_4_9_14_3_um_filter_48_9]HCW76142.1 peptidase M3 [Candidatus Neomarinimicrobiota bacterium]
MTPQTNTGAETIRWNLSDLFNGLTDPKIETTLDAAEKKVEAFVQNYRGKLADLSAAELLQAFKDEELLISPLYQLSQFAHLNTAADTADETAKALEARVDEALSKISNQMVFFNLELAAMSDADFAKFDGAPELEDYKYPVYQTRKNAKYNLSEKEEQILILKSLTSSRANQKLYDELTSSFQFEFELDGEMQPMNGSQLRSLRMHPDKDVRRRAMQVFFERYADNKLVITHLYNTIVKDFGLEQNLRGYKTPISIMNTHNDLEEEAVQALIDVTTESYRLVQRYYKIKANLLGLDDMTLADIYAPLPQSPKGYNFDDAKALVLDAFGSFDAEFQSFAKAMFDENRVDAPVTPTKRGGAFCSSSTPDLKPYVLLNFTGKLRDVSTMAHELGHAIHAMLGRNLNLSTFHAILPLAETASVFSEMVLTDYFLKRETDTAVKQALLTNKLEDIFATSHRQNMFSRFEMAAHDRINGGLQSSSDLCELYRSELKNMFGDAVNLTDEYSWEWSSIPHIFQVPFYVYAYNFGNLLVLALYQQYLEEGDAFIPKYKKFLSMGSSAKPTEIAALVGADISNPEFWRKSLKYIEHLIDELEETL